MSKALPKWTDDRTSTLESIVDNESPVSQDTVATAAEELETTARSVASKLRKMGHEVESTAKAVKHTFTDAQSSELEDYVTSNSGDFTYAEIADAVTGTFSAKQVQGKLLSMELTSHVKETPKREVVKAYSDAEEAVVIKMANSGAYLEDIAEATGKSLNSVRGKCLALSNSVEGFKRPEQRESYAKTPAVDALAALGDVSGLTVDEIATQIEKSVRGVKSMLTKRGITASDYDGAKKRAKLDEKAAA